MNRNNTKTNFDQRLQCAESREARGKARTRTLKKIALYVLAGLIITYMVFSLVMGGFLAR